MNSVNTEIKRFAHSVGQNWYHIVLVPKARYPVFQWIEVKQIADESFDWICKNHGFDLFTKEVMPDHVHLFVSCPPDYSIRRMIQVLKGGSSYYIRKNYPSLKKYKHLWNRGAMYRTVGNVNAETVKHYIENSNSWSKTKQRKL
jgi:putative transposase